MTEEKSPYTPGDNVDSQRRAVVTDHLQIDVKQLTEAAPPFARELEKLLTELDSPVAWLKISNVRLVAQGLKEHFERIDGLLGQLEEQAMEKVREEKERARDDKEL
jgi:hypothetical protein